ncbi:MAG TPA: acyl carrier protein [Candidatus Acidoferrales bacterium]|nr:acyl carrier protein [Candidatus Acidoferrales bacterium]
MDGRLRAVIASAMGAPEAAIEDDSTNETVAEWDSLAEVQIAIGIERHYRIELSDADDLRMISVREIRAVLAERGIPT